mgnify:CR=1 FL=1
MKVKDAQFFTVVSSFLSKLEPFHPPKHTGIRGLVGESQELQ